MESDVVRSNHFSRSRLTAASWANAVELDEQGNQRPIVPRVLGRQACQDFIIGRRSWQSTPAVRPGHYSNVLRQVLVLSKRPFGTECAIPIIKTAAARITSGRARIRAWHAKRHIIKAFG